MNPPDNNTTFRVYLNPAPPTKESKHGTYLLCHHGAGASGLSFAALAKEIKAASGGELGVLAFDGRGHGKHHSRERPKVGPGYTDVGSTGKTRTDGTHEQETDLSLPTLLSDCMGVVRHMYPDPKESPAFVVGFSETRPGSMQSQLTVSFSVTVWALVPY